jgi:hypothetical protein
MLGYIVTFIKVLKIYQLYQYCIHPLYYSLFLLFHFWNSFCRYHFSICIHMYTVFAPYSPSTSFSTPSTLPLYQLPRQDLFYPSILLFFKKTINNIFIYLQFLYREFPHDISMCIYIITQISSSPLFFTFLP